MTLFFFYVVTTFTIYMGHWMNMIPRKNQTDVINDFDFICKIEGYVIYEHIGMADCCQTMSAQKRRWPIMAEIIIMNNVTPSSQKPR